jgi:hypothetical protein
MYMKKKGASESIEQKKWYKNINAILVLILAVVSIIGGLITITHWDPFKQPKVQQNIEIILDSSANFSGGFNGKTKIDAAKAAMKDTLGGDVMLLKTWHCACLVDFVVIREALSLQSILDCIMKRMSREH